MTVISVVYYTYKPYTLVGPTTTRLVQDPLAVKLLDNQLYMSPDSHMKYESLFLGMLICATFTFYFLG